MEHMIVNSKRKTCENWQSKKKMVLKYKWVSSPSGAQDTKDKHPCSGCYGGE